MLQGRKKQGIPHAEGDASLRYAHVPGTGRDEIGKGVWPTAAGELTAAAHLADGRAHPEH